MIKELRDTPLAETIPIGRDAVLDVHDPLDGDRTRAQLFFMLRRSMEVILEKKFHLGMNFFF